MFIIHALAAVSMISMSGLAAAPGSGMPAETQSLEHSLVIGAWTGKFLQKDWIFKFSHEDGKWHGTFITSGGRSWQPLNEILVSRRSITFSIASEPKANFSLEVDETDPKMSGTVTLDGFGTVPFSATRAP